MGEALSTVAYGYNDSNWGDLLTAYNGVTITHNQIGNPLNDGTWTYDWDGRQLDSMTNGITTWSYKYNADGLRTEKTDGTTTYKYYYSGDQLIRMTVGNNVLEFIYDGNTPKTVTVNGSTYYYITNLQGDVVAIVNGQGRSVALYSYDAWGNVIGDSGGVSAIITQLNPLRYRGYVYDSDTGLYYLQSRYYDPQTGRFINADIYASTGQGILGNNMFAYCNNSPTNHMDSQGKSPDWNPWYDFGEAVSRWLWELTQDDYHAIESGEVSYIKNKNNDGAHIHNSHKIKTPWAMVKFINKNRGNEIEGSTAGVVFEWFVHNVAYEITKSESAAHVDVGTTIWADRHGLASVGMGLSYLVSSPISAIYDYIMEYDDYDLLYPRE